RGETPTIAQVADEALMTRTTVYRYFPTQESLLLELSITLSLAEVDDLLAAPFVEDAAPRERLVELVEVFNRYVAANEPLMRTAQRHYLDTWLAAERAGEGHDQHVREGRRLQWITTILQPMRGRVPDTELRRLELALCLVLGAEAFTVLRDVCHLEADEAVEVTKWATEALLSAGLRTATP
ncbi:MAG TPA: TetR/AcrR family transcriptional regulator, partial [Acidimicrobiales bacterium]|nr:TetR/AcrR family transcriptional regulator [Acidimicrobiales bacterium]